MYINSLTYIYRERVQINLQEEEEEEEEAGHMNMRASCSIVSN